MQKRLETKRNGLKAQDSLPKNAIIGAAVTRLHTIHPSKFGSEGNYEEKNVVFQNANNKKWTWKKESQRN